MSRRSKPKYFPPRPRRKTGSGRFFWLVLLVLAAVAVALWFWWPRSPAPAPVQPQPQPQPLPPLATNLVTRYVPPAPVLRPLGPISPIPPRLLLPMTPTVPLTALPTNAPAKAPKSQPLPVITPSANGFPRPVSNPFEAQVALARLAISSGSIDGAMGSQTHEALREFQVQKHLPATGKLDAATRSVLMLDAPALTSYTVTDSDLARLQPIGKTWLEKSQQSALEFETELELVGEYSHANPALIRKLNPRVDWANLAPGAVLQIPDVQYPDPEDKAALVIIHLSGKYLEAFDESSNLLAHFPCSIAAHVEKRPVGLLHVIVIAPNPNYTFDPAVFPESPEAQKLGRKLILPAGPNNPVGVAWMGLDRPGYGMHGTPAPEQVGRTESHGCFRLANWDAAYMVKLVWIGMPVNVVP